MEYEREQQIAISAVTAAATLCERVRHDRQDTTLHKGDRSPVTIADFGSQAIICRALGDAFPADPIVAEEDANLLRLPEQAPSLDQVTSYVQSIVLDAPSDEILGWIDRGNGTVGQRYWTLDPIDGTKGFLRGDQYAIALALVEVGEVKLGVLGCPALTVNVEQVGNVTGVLFVAVRGRGTTLIPLQTGHPYPLRAAATLDTAQPRLTESVETAHGNIERQRIVAQAIGFTTPPLAMDSQAKYGAVACGQAALYLRLPWTQVSNYQEKIWDHAAGAIVVEEAGGRVSDMNGKPLDFTSSSQLVKNSGIVASNGAIYDRVISALRQV